MSVRAVLIIVIQFMGFVFAKAQAFDLSFLDSMNQKYKFYFSGEFHSKSNFGHRYDLLTKLYKSNNVRVLILEAPKEFEYEFNMYVKMADTSTCFLRALHRGYRMSHPFEFDAFIKKIKKFNGDISDSLQKISIVCADQISSLSYGLLKFYFIFPKGYTENSYLRKTVKRAGRMGLWGREQKNTKKQAAIVYKLKFLLDNYPSDVKEYYGQNFIYAKRIINSLYRNAMVYDIHTLMPDSLRERIIYEDILEAYKERENVSYYGNYGQMHILLNCDPSSVILNNLEITSSMANKLNNTSGLRGKVFSMPYYYMSMDSLSSARNTKYFKINFLTEEEQSKYLQELNKYNFIYVPTEKLARSKELEGMFQYLMICK